MKTFIERVREIMHDYPLEMVEHSASDVLARSSDAPLASVVSLEDVAWLVACAALETSKPKVYTRVMSDGVRLDDPLG